MQVNRSSCRTPDSVGAFRSIHIAVLRLNRLMPLYPNTRREMPVTTKSHLSAESEDNTNSVKPRMYEFVSKIKKSAKTGDFPNGLLTPTCGPD
jgi:hypothetical protein